MDNKAKKSALESYLRGLAEDTSMGYSDEIAGGLESAAGSMGLIPDKTYEQAVKESREAYKQAELDNPKSYMAGEATGTAASMLVPGGLVKAGLKGARRLALQNVGKSLAESYGRSNGEEMSAADIGMSLSNALPMKKIASKLPEWKVGKNVKRLLEKEVKDTHTGKIVEKLDPLQETLLSSKGKVIQKLDPIQEAELTGKGKAIWDGYTPIPAPPKKAQIHLGNLEEEKIKAEIARKRIQAQKELGSIETQQGLVKKEMKNAEQELPLKPSLRREYFEDKAKELNEKEIQKANLSELLNNLKTK